MITFNENKSNEKINPPGNRTEGSKKYKDPVGNKEKINTPKNSGYDEKQPKSDKSN